MTEVGTGDREPDAVKEEPINGFQALGWTLIVVGAGLAGAAFMFDVSVATGQAALYGVPDRIANVDRIAVRHMMLACGLAGFVSGWIVVGAHAVREALTKS